jgi:hypothetical protein
MIMSYFTHVLQTTMIISFAAFFVPTAFAQDDDTSSKLECFATTTGANLVRVRDQVILDRHATIERCEEVRIAAHGGVVCIWFTSSMHVGPGGWQETGWRTANVETKMGLGRKVLASFEQCLEVSRSANGGVVCTNTGLGAKAANINTNNWCGASSQMQYCLIATSRAKDFTVCSFPSDGSGAEPGWIRTKVTGSCSYQSGPMSLHACNESIENN